MSTPVSAGDPSALYKRHPWEVFEAALVKRLGDRAICGTAGCHSTALKSRWIGGASNSHGGNLIQLMCEACGRRCRVRAALVQGGEACEGLLA
ncbi:hypothetical protein HDU84_001483, partial [Entophlyctis sp. JEL0112]